jgi:type II secretory pathway component GspD/PulD (secretin)
MRVRHVRCISAAAVLLAAAGSLTWVAASGPFPPVPSTEGGKPGKGERVVYPVRHGTAAELAKVLSQFFRNDPEVEILAEPTSNSLLIRVPSSSLGDILKTLQQVDRSPRQVSVEVFIAEIVPADGGKGPMPKFVAKDFTGPTDQVLAKIHGLKDGRQLGAVKRIQLATLEGQQATMLVGEMKPMITGTSKGGGFGGKGTTYTIQYRDVGMNVTLTPRVSPEGVVALDLKLEESRLHVPQDGVQIGLDESGTPIRATETVTTRLNCQLAIASSQAVCAEGVEVTSRSREIQTLVIVTARVLEPGAK